MLQTIKGLPDQFDLAKWKKENCIQKANYIPSPGHAAMWKLHWMQVRKIAPVGNPLCPRSEAIREQLLRDVNIQRAKSTL